MSRVDWKERVIIDPKVHHGDPCIKETRIPVNIIVGSIADGMDFKAILSAYPQLIQEDINAALAYAGVRNQIKHSDPLISPPDERGGNR